MRPNSKKGIFNLSFRLTINKEIDESGRVDCFLSSHENYWTSRALGLSLSLNAYVRT